MPKKTSIKRRVPAYKLHAASGQARTIICGRHLYLGKHGSPESWEKYNRLVAEHIANGPPGAQASGQRLSVVEVIAFCWKEAKQHYVKEGQPTGELPLVRRAWSLLHEHFGGAIAAEFGPQHLRALQARLVHQGLSRSYINAQIRRVKMLFRWAANYGLLPASVHYALSLMPGLRKGRSTAREPAPVGSIEDHIVAATLPHLPPIIADMVQLQRLTGCRPGEICRLRPCDVNLDSTPWSFRPATHKTEHHGRGRAVFIGPRAQAILKPYLNRDPMTFCFSPSESIERRRQLQRSRRKTRVQPSQESRRKAQPKRKPSAFYKKDAYNWAIRRACDKADLIAHAANPSIPAETRIVPRWHPNQLRHSAGTEIRQQFGLEAAQVVLGHSRADVTQIYAERDLTLAAKVAAAVG